MPILDQLQKDLVAAMKAREEARLSAIRMIKSALQKAHVDSAKNAHQQIAKWNRTQEVGNHNDNDDEFRHVRTARLSKPVRRQLGVLRARR